MLEQIEKTRGNISAIARAYDVSRTAVYNWINDSTTLQQAVSDSRHRMVDDAESVLYKQVVTDQNMQAVMYVLNNMQEAKQRGWGPRQEVDVNANVTIAKGYAIVSPDDWDDDDAS